jgi:S1-C subfamily serine protease
VLVVTVRPGSPAAAGGVLAGDIIETVNGTPFVLPQTPRLAAAPGNAALTFGLVREGRRLTVNVNASGEQR